MKWFKHNALDVELNLIEALGAVFILLIALFFQWHLNELPCPLCLLQRIGFFGIAFGIALNMRFGPHPSHYGLSILSAVFTMFASGRQILLHIAPGTGSYGNAIFGMHLYTWSFIAAAAFILMAVILLVFEKQFHRIKFKHNKWVKSINKLIIGLIALLILSNAISTYMECGLSACADNPTRYIHKIEKAPQNVDQTIAVS